MDKPSLINSRTRHRQMLKTLMELLEQDQQWHVSEIATRLGCHVRTVYNCLNNLENKGIRINRNDGHPRLWNVSFNPATAESLLIAPDDMIRINKYLAVLSGKDGASLPRRRKGHQGDTFHMLGRRVYPVKLLLTMRAKLLLEEEYPLSRRHITQADDTHWLYTDRVAKLEGVGRFVIGLSQEVQIVECPDLKAYVVDTIRNTLKLYE